MSFTTSFIATSTSADLNPSPSPTAASLFTATSTSTPTTTIPGTLTSLLALTRPFVPPTDCPTVQDFSFSNTATYAVGVSLCPVLYSNPANPAYAACQPSGWASVTEPLQHSYSPAVCPSDWVAISMGYGMITFVTTSGTKTQDTSRVVSTAYCCKPSYYINVDEPRSYVLRTCTKSITSRENYDSFIPTTTILVTSSYPPDFTPVSFPLPFSTGLLLHPAWHISWDQSDTNYLWPEPPTLTSDMLIPTWKPGDIIEAGKYDNHGAGKNNIDGWNTTSTFLKFLYIGVPIIVFVLISLCCFSGIRSHRRKKKRKREAAAAAEIAGVDALPAGSEATIRNSTDSDTGAPPCYDEGMRRSRPPAYELTTITR